MGRVGVVCPLTWVRDAGGRACQSLEVLGGCPCVPERGVGVYGSPSLSAPLGGVVDIGIGQVPYDYDMAATSNHIGIIKLRRCAEMKKDTYDKSEE
jgi:hypothetical protein